MNKVNIFKTFILPFLFLIIISLLSGFFDINPRTIDRQRLWDSMGQPVEVFAKALNLPEKFNAVLIAGTEDKLQRAETYQGGDVELGYVLTNQLRSWLFGTQINPTTLAFFINFVFCALAIVFSFLVGYFIFRNVYFSVPILLLIILLRNFSQGLIYALPNKYAYPVFFPLISFIILVAIIVFLPKIKKIISWYVVYFILAGMGIAYVTHVRASEGYILTSSIIMFIITIALCCWVKFGRSFYIIKSIVVILIGLLIGMVAYQGMVDGLKFHRDKTLHLTPKIEKEKISGHPIFHILFASLFRFPNKYKMEFDDKFIYDYVLERHPDLKMQYGIDYPRLAHESARYYDLAKIEYFSFTKNDPWYFLGYIKDSFLDYILFLPYYSWSGTRAAHAYLPKLRDDIRIEAEDQPFGFRQTPWQWIINLKWKYLPVNPLFWAYAILAYLMLLQALYSSLFFLIRKKEEPSLNEYFINHAPDFLLLGMLIYFFFASIVRILIPNYGHSAVIAFNVIAIYNLVRLYSGHEHGILKFLEKIKRFRHKVLNKIGKMSMNRWGFDFSLKIKIPLVVVVLLLAAFLGYINRMDNAAADIKRKNAELEIVKEGFQVKYLKLTNVQPTEGYFYFTVPVEEGKEYKITFRYRRNGNAVGRVVVETIMQIQLYNSASIYKDIWTEHEAIFKTVSDLVVIKMYSIGDNPLNSAVYYDSISVENMANNQEIFRF